MVVDARAGASSLEPEQAEAVRALEYLTTAVGRASGGEVTVQRDEGGTRWEVILTPGPKHSTSKAFEDHPDFGRLEGVVVVDVDGAVRLVSGEADALATERARLARGESIRPWRLGLDTLGVGPHEPEPGTAATLGRMDRCGSVYRTTRDAILADDVRGELRLSPAAQTIAAQAIVRFYVQYMMALGMLPKPPADDRRRTAPHGDPLRIER